jgi:hypothetical protein
MRRFRFVTHRRAWLRLCGGPYKIKNCRTTSTEQRASIATDSDTLPITSRSNPRLPCDPITTTKVSEAHDDGSEQLLHATASACVFPRAR